MNEAPSFLIAIRDGPLAGAEFAVTGDVIVGRVEAAITVPDPEISRQHAVLRTTPAGLEIEDMESLNGTYVNGDRITGPTQLRPDDLIRLGDTTLVVRVQARAGTVQADRMRERPPPPQAVPASGLPPARPFSPPQPRRRRSRAPASRSAAATVLSVGTVVATAVALIVYFALH